MKRPPLKIVQHQHCRRLTSQVPCLVRSTNARNAARCPSHKPTRPSAHAEARVLSVVASSQPTTSSRVSHRPSTAPSSSRRRRCTSVEFAYTTSEAPRLAWSSHAVQATSRRLVCAGLSLRRARRVAAPCQHATRCGACIYCGEGAEMLETMRQARVRGRFVYVLRSQNPR
jgi:hypothetical protein